MLKKLSLMLLSMMLLASCSSMDEVIIHNEGIDANRAELEYVYNRIDSINSVYIMKAQDTRGFIDWGMESAATTAADNAGRTAGSYAGKYLGGAAGSLSANPLGTISGYVIGHYVGGAIGSAAASYAAHLLYNRFFTRSVDYSTVVKMDSLPNVNQVNLDSITLGDLHNCIVIDLLNNGGRYVDSKGNVNYSLIYDDCILYAKKHGVNVEKDKEFLDSIKPIVVQQTKILATKSAESRRLNDTPEAYYEKVYPELSKISYIPKEDYNIAINMDLKLSGTYVKLKKEDIKDCELEINKTIYNSNLSDDVKIEMQSANSIVANSTLLWRTVAESK